MRQRLKSIDSSSRRGCFNIKIKLFDFRSIGVHVKLITAFVGMTEFVRAKLNPFLGIVVAATS